MIKAVFFDLDGVLVDACEWHFVAFNRAMKDLLGREIDYDYHLSHLNGRPTKVKMDLLAVPQELRTQLWSLKQTYTLLTIETMARLDDIKIEMHRALDTKGIESWCVTNSIALTARTMLEKTGQWPFITGLISNDMCQKHKPDPHCYDLALAQSGFDPKDIIVVEDSPVGLEAAHNSQIARRGGLVLAVSGPQDVKKELFEGIV